MKGVSELIWHLQIHAVKEHAELIRMNEAASRLLASDRGPIRIDPANRQPRTGKRIRKSVGVTSPFSSAEALYNLSLGQIGLTEGHGNFEVNAKRYDTGVDEGRDGHVLLGRL